MKLIKSILVIISLTSILSIQLSRKADPVLTSSPATNPKPELSPTGGPIIVPKITPNVPPSTTIEGNDANSSAQIQVYNLVPKAPINSLTKFVNDPSGGQTLLSDPKETKNPDATTQPHTNISSPFDKNGAPTSAAALASAEGYKTPTIGKIPLDNSYLRKK